MLLTKRRVIFEGYDMDLLEMEIQRFQDFFLNKEEMGDSRAKLYISPPPFFKAWQKGCLKHFTCSTNIFSALTGVWTDTSAMNPAKQEG